MKKMLVCIAFGALSMAASLIALARACERWAEDSIDGGDCLITRDGVDLLDDADVDAE